MDNIKREIIKKIVKYSKEESEIAQKTLILFIAYLEEIRITDISNEIQEENEEIYFDLKDLANRIKAGTYSIDDLADNYVNMQKNISNGLACGRVLDEIRNFSKEYCIKVIDELSKTKQLIESIEDYEFLIDNCSYYKSENWTPYWVNRLMVKLLEVKDHETVLDPVSGNGVTGMLASAEGGILYSSDIDDNLIMTQVLEEQNYLHRWSSYFTTDSIIYNWTNCFEDYDEERDNFDKTIGQPPFSFKMDKNINKEARTIDKYIIKNRTSGDLCFYNSMVKLANKKSIFMVPVKFLYQTSEDYIQFKKWLLDNNYLSRIILLPKNTLLPASGIESAIVEIDKDRKNTTIELIDLNESKYVYKSGRGIECNIDSINDLFNEIKERDDNFYKIVISKNLIEKNQYKLLKELYVKKEEKSPQEDLGELLNEMEDIKKKLDILIKETNEIIKDMK